MRRTDKQITDPKMIHEILSTNTICRVALSDGIFPYVIPMNYGYKDNSIFLHTAVEGRKLQIIRSNNNVCVEISDSIELVTSENACGYGTKFRSVIATGTVSEVKDPSEKIAALNLIMAQHTGKDDWDIPEKAVSKVTILRIDIKEITGKASGL